MFMITTHHHHHQIRRNRFREVHHLLERVLGTYPPKPVALVVLQLGQNRDFVQVSCQTQIDPMAERMKMGKDSNFLVDEHCNLGRKLDVFQLHSPEFDTVDEVEYTKSWIGDLVENLRKQVVVSRKNWMVMKRLDCVQYTLGWNTMVEVVHRKERQQLQNGRKVDVEAGDSVV